MNDIITVCGELILNPQVAEKIVELERLVKTVKAQEDELKAALLEEMQEKQIYKVETPDLLITYVDAFERESFDSKKLRKEMPDVYDEFVRFSPVKPSLRITLK